MKNLNDDTTISNDNIPAGNAEALGSIIGYLQNGDLGLAVAYVTDPETGYITHNYIVLAAGDMKITSMPEPLDPPFMLAGKPEGATLN
jgi:hypothetical protein